MYRTPVRRGFSPDSYRDSPHSRGHSPPRHRSPSRRGRSPDRHSRSPGRHGRSSERRGRSRSRSRHRSRSRSRHRSRSRPGGRARSKSRGRVGRSRSRPRRSPSSGRRRSPGDPYRYEGRRSDQHRHSPSYRSNPASDHHPLASTNDRVGSIKSFGHDSSPHVYQSSSDSPLPMPKSILKKRVDMEPSSSDQSPQVDSFSSNNAMSSSSSAGVGNGIENNLISESTLPMMGLLKSCTSTSSAAANAQSAESPVPHGSTPSTTAPTSWALNKSVEIGMKGSVPDITPPCEQNEGPKGNQLSSTLGDLLFNKSTPKSHIDPYCNLNVFSENKEGVQKGADEAGGFLLPHEQDSKLSPLPRKPLPSNQRSSVEIEDEERFLYGEEEDKKAPSGQTASTPSDKSSQNKQEFEKIHDLLKTIGLDIGVAEIGKLAVRTQERLHGKKVPLKMSQPAQSAAAASIAEPKTKVSEPQVKMEKKEKEEAEAAVKTEPPIKPAPKEPTPPASHPSPAHKPKLILRTCLPKEATAAPKANISVQPPTTIPVQSPIPVANPTPPPMSPSQMPVYPPYPHSPMVPAYNMPPPSYNPYTPYVSYPTSSWNIYSPMPPQPSPPQMPTLAPHVPVSTSASTYNTRSNLRLIETTADLSDTKAAVKSDTKPTTPIAAFLAKQEADRKNKEAEKLKVLEELDSVRKEHKVKSESLRTLSIKVEQLRVQQGILLRKKRREKDGHKDPLLEELNNVLESAQKQINSLREENSTTKQKQQQLTKVAEILGVSPSELVEKSDPNKEERSPGSLAPTRDSDNESRTSIDSSNSANDLKTSNEPVSKVDAKAKSDSKSGAETKSSGAAYSFKVTEKSEDVKCEGTPPISSPDPKNSPEPCSPYLSKSEEVLKSRDKSRSKSPRPCPPSSKTLPKSEEPSLFSLSEIFEYYDSGSHWCEDCNAICMTLPEFLLHLHDKKHSQCVKAAKQPWVKKKVQESGTTKKQKVNIPLKGTEFLFPVNGYYCELCEELFPDHTAAEEHLRAYAHNDKYKKHTDVHMNYEVARRQKKRVSLIAAQEGSRKQAEQKRKMAEQKREAHEHSKYKKAKKEEQDKDRKAKSKSYSSASTSSSDRRRNKTPEKEPSKNSFGKFVWKTTENKTPAAVSSSRVDTASTKPKDEEPKAFSLKPKGFAIKLLGKPSALPGNTLSPSHSAASTTITSTASTVSSTFTSPSSPTSSAQTKIRPNLPSLANIRSATPLVTTSKPAPLDTFLSIRSSSTTSKSIPIVKNKPSGVFPEDLVSKAFGGEVVILKESTKPDSTAKTENKEHERTAGASPKALQTPKGQDLFNVLISKKDTVENQEAKSEKERSVPKQPVSSSPQKSDLDSISAQHKTHSAPTKPAQSPGPTTLQQTQIKSPVLNSASSTVGITASVKSSINSSTNSLFKLAKSDSPVIPTNQQTAKAGYTPTREESGVQQSQEANTPSKLEKETPQQVKASTFSMNPLTGRLEYIPVQQTKVIDTNVQKLPEPKHTPTAVTHVSNVQVNKPVSISPVLAVPKTKFIVNTTTKLNQKFKKDPLSLPSSLFGHVQDAGCKDIKITSVESQKSNNRADKSESPLLPSQQKQVSSSSSAKPVPAKSSTMQQELDSYYKSIASEDDPEDLTTSEDQDSEAATTPAKAPLQPRVESPPEKKVKLESTPSTVKASVKPLAPEVSCEDVDESDMACEVPEGPLSSVSQTSGWNFMRASNASNQIHGSNNQRPWSLASVNFSMNKDQSKTTQVATVASPENSLEDLSVYVTCDSD